MTLLQPELLAQLATSFPDAVAWKDLGDGGALTLDRWNRDANRLARGMHSRGLEPGERVVLAITEDEPFEWLVSYMAVHRAGAVAVPLNTRLSEPEMRRILEHAAPSAILLSGDLLRTRSGLAAQVRLAGATGHGHGIERWDDLMDADDSALDHRLRGEDLADIMYTSGTTGAPKGVAVCHDGLASLDRVPAAWLGLGFITSSPFSTTSGSLLVCGPMRGGLSGWFLPHFDPARWLEAVATERPVAGFLVPAMVQLLVAHPDFASADLSSLAVLNIGSAPIAAETLRRFGAALGSTEVTCGYGMTEFGAVTTMPMGDAGRHMGSVGRPLPGVDLRIVGPDGEDRGTGEEGEVLIGGTRSPRSYLGDPELSRSNWEGGWLHSGDLGYLDPDGFLWIVGRQKEIIIRGGHNIVPGEVEAALFAHPHIADAAVAGIAHPVLGEDVAAWVVPGSASPPPIDELRAFLAARLADYKVPRRITFVDALPRNEAGKVLKGKLVSGEEQRSGS